ncbi:MAG TPA: class I SAM-dependent methyltransferase [Candidatus Dormibacteraeota bacterium]|nr:class I SAM-dependent methyltransferase [Candidatus Dormibacteraeota bacterium]
MTEPWNHNFHYHRVLLERIPKPCRAALDIGCGDGILAAKLASRAGYVTAIDKSGDMIAKARIRLGFYQNVSLIEGDFLAEPLPPESFDFVVAVAAVHHMPFEAAIQRMARLLEPGGVMAVVGLARNGAPGAWGPSPVDYSRIPPALIYSWWLQLRKGRWDSGAPIQDPEMTYGQSRGSVRRLLPEAELQRRLLFRYTLFWRKPA